MNESTTKRINKIIADRLSNHVTTTDIVVLLSLTEAADLPTKSAARQYLEQYMTDNDIVKSKPASKSGQLKDWYLAQPDYKAVSSSMIKDKCLELDMKGGSVQYYVNSYKLVGEVLTQIGNSYAI